jgi:hypothetical protein
VRRWTVRLPLLNLMLPDGSIPQIKARSPSPIPFVFLSSKWRWAVRPFLVSAAVQVVSFLNSTPPPSPFVTPPPPLAPPWCFFRAQVADHVFFPLATEIAPAFDTPPPSFSFACPGGFLSPGTPGRPRTGSRNSTAARFYFGAGHPADAITGAGHAGTGTRGWEGWGRVGGQLIIMGGRGRGGG